MGNADMVYIFNDKTVIIIPGTDYSTQTEKPLYQALKQYKEKAKDNINYWYEAKKENPESVIEGYDPEIEWEIKSIRVFSAVL